MSNEKLLINDSKSNNSEDMSNKQIEKMAEDLSECHAEFESGSEIYTDYDATARGLIDKGWCKQEWISVDERLPPNAYTVLALCKDGGMFVGRYMSFKCWEIWTAMKSTRIVNRKVTHWMPLPEMREGEE